MPQGPATTALPESDKVKSKSGKPGASTAKAPAKRRQYLPAAERREQLLDAAREVFLRSGLKGARVREIAQAAGVNQATLFEHFSSKEDLFSAAVVEPLVATMEGARERTESYAAATSTEELAARLQGGMRQYLTTMVDVYPLLLQALTADRDLAEKLYREQISPLLDARAEITKPFIRDSLDPKLIQLASFGMFFAIAMDQAMTGETRDTAEVARQLTDLISFGSSALREK